MSAAGRMRIWVNRALRPVGVRIESLAAERAESKRIARLVESGQFDRPVLPVLDAFQHCEPAAVLASVRKYAAETAKFATPARPDCFHFSNDYFTSPDAEVAYALVRDLAPSRIIEVGSGNSTWLFRSAIGDGDLGTELVSIDPSPRREISSIADRVLRQRLEETDLEDLVDSLGHGDVLFIDSSHNIEAGNDVVTLLLRVVPALRPGVVIHLHDIFLPFEYPREWLVELGWRWNEQYLVQALLQDSLAVEVLWPGHYLQRTLPGFGDYFVAPTVGLASSLWLRRCP